MHPRDEIARTLLRLGKTEFDMLSADALPGSPAHDWTATLAATRAQGASVWTVRPLHLGLPDAAEGTRAEIRTLAIESEDAFRAGGARSLPMEGSLLIALRHQPSREALRLQDLRVSGRRSRRMSMDSEPETVTLPC